jgi:hypothetical protein
LEDIIVYHRRYNAPLGTRMAIGFQKKPLSLILYREVISQEITLVDFEKINEAS